MDKIDGVSKLAQRRATKREELLCATEKDLDKLVLRTQKEKRALSGADKIGLAVGKVIKKHKIEKHFDLTITDNGFSYSRKQDEINREALLDGIYVVKTPVSKKEMNDNDVVLSYKGLARVERAFRTLKTSQLEIRSILIYHWNEERVKGHALLCMLAYYVEWHLSKKTRTASF